MGLVSRRAENCSYPILEAPSVRRCVQLVQFPEHSGEAEA